MIYSHQHNIEVGIMGKIKYKLKPTKSEIVDSIMHDVSKQDLEQFMPIDDELMEEDADSIWMDKMMRWKKKDLKEFLKKYAYK